MPSRELSPSSAMAAVQGELDGLAAALGRSVSLDDPEGTLLGYSVQGLDVDTARVESILTRRVPEAVMAYQRRFGVDRATGLVRVPANPDLQMTARTCLAIRHQDRQLALLWVLDHGRPLDAADGRTVRACAERLSTLLSPIQPSPGDLLAELFDDGAPPDLTDPFRLAPRPAGLLQFVAIGTRLVDDDGSEPPRLGGTAGVIASAHRRGRSLMLTAPARAPADPAGRSVPTPMPAGEVVGRSATFAPGTVDPNGVAGLATQALVTADCAATDPALPPSSTWDGLGLHRRLLLMGRPEDWPGPQPIPEDGRSAEMLRATLEVYLDHAGDAARTISALQIHRTTFYYRLDRLTRLYGVDLDDGLARTAHHLALKTRRLAAARDRFGWTAEWLARVSAPVAE